MDEVKKARSRNLNDSFRHAIHGIHDALRLEPNLRIHAIGSLIALIGAIFLKFNTIEWAIAVLTISSVFLMELINTVLETIVDIISPEIREKARIAKDVAAAGVLLAAINALIIAALLYLPKIIQLF